MANICCEITLQHKAAKTTDISVIVMKGNEASPCENQETARRRRMEMRRCKVSSEPENGVKRRKISELCRENSVGNMNRIKDLAEAETVLTNDETDVGTNPKYGTASICGRRRDMEDAVVVHPSLCCTSEGRFHYFGVYDGHGCSHVAMKCRQRLHDLVKEEVLEMEEDEEEIGKWKNAMGKSFMKMEEEIIAWNKNMVGASCRCELRTPECDAVGSTAVVAIVTPLKIIVANVGDSRAVLCRNAQPVPLSIDHKPDRPDEVTRIQAAGGRVIYWDGPRVQGMLAMSRAIGDNYLKPYVICEPEVTITDRSDDDECLILASDGLWDVVSNEMACSVARMCLKGKGAAAMVEGGGASGSLPTETYNSDKACSDASMLLTKLALARRSADNVSVVVVDLRENA